MKWKGRERRGNGWRENEREEAIGNEGQEILRKGGKKGERGGEK